MCCTRLAENTGRKNDSKNRRLLTIAQLCRAISSQLRHVSTIGKKLVKQQYLLHMFSQYGGWDLLASLGHPNKFQQVSRLGFVTAATPLTGGQPNFARCLAVSWLHYIYIFEGSCHLTEFCPVQNSSYVQVLCSRILAALIHGIPAKLCGVLQGMELPNFRRGRHLYSSGRPSRWASVHILVFYVMFMF